MATKDTSKIKESILNFLNSEGPNLPIKISKNVKIDSLFISAFLSELIREQKIKITNMKVGTSPIYYIEGTESGLEKFSNYLKPKEKEALSLLKEKNFLEDESQHPAIKIALRSIKDFAKPFKIKDKIFWRYFLTPITEFKKPETSQIQSSTKNEEPRQKNLNPLSKEIKKETPDNKLPTSFVSSIQQTMQKNEEKEKSIETKENPPIEQTVKESEEKSLTQKFKKESQNSNLQFPTQKKSEFLNPLATSIQTQTKEETPKPEFCQKIINIINQNNWQIIKEINYKKKEYNALIQIQSDLGPIIFKLLAKDKKTVGEADMSKLLGEAQSIPLPALFMTHGEPKKKANEFLSKYTSILKYKQIK